MISAEEALKLSSAQLSRQELDAVNSLLELIERKIRSSMKYGGIVIETDEIRSPVTGAVSLILHKNHWRTEWQQNIKPPHIHGQQPYLAGFILILAPTEEAYEAAEKEKLQ